MSVDKKLLEILVCPTTKVPVSLLSPDKLATLNRIIEQGEVRFDGVSVLSWAGTLDTAFGGIGISAATGGSDSEHRVRDVCVTERF